ncbi:hypothetical protein BCON_0266g00140 [Botryotinia convoluta]|uniref:Uncharacterized protein n=1 Tax=Botryotinia convoluta TaxID=54673 RepID=A0A4Z1HEZ1_9HELO|nr:hypothetical protein BCON_0266g00140 [Botryotinia convoluta]
MNLKGSGLAESHHSAFELPREPLNPGTIERLLVFRMPIELRVKGKRKIGAWLKSVDGGRNLDQISTVSWSGTGP